MRAGMGIGVVRLLFQAAGRGRNRYPSRGSGMLSRISMANHAIVFTICAFRACSGYGTSYYGGYRFDYTHHYLHREVRDD